MTLLVFDNWATGSKWDFQVADLLLASVNFDPCLSHHAKAGVTKSSKS